MVTLGQFALYVEVGHGVVKGSMVLVSGYAVPVESDDRVNLVRVHRLQHGLRNNLLAPPHTGVVPQLGVTENKLNKFKNKNKKGCFGYLVDLVLRAMPKKQSPHLHTV